MIYELWEATDHGELSLFPSEGRDAHPVLTHDVYGKPMVLVASFWADSWPEAIEARDAIMGW